MSCPNATAPINISLSSITGNCDYKCSYSFNYNNSSCVVTNRGDYVLINYDKATSPPVLYNSSAFDVKEIRLYTPSLHSYENNKTDAELIIVHTSNTGAKPLLVCIPIKANNTSSISALMFKEIINTMASSAPVDGETTTVNLHDFNLSKIVPRKPFYSYSATEPYQPCYENVDYIVYVPSDTSLDMLTDNLTTLQNIITSNPYDIKKGPEVFYNKKGPNKDGMGDDIYIDCQPINSGNSGNNETTEVVTSYDDSTSTQISLSNPYIQILLGTLLFIIILYTIKYSLNMI
jgi:carbonic anhydrase